jgi:hypothetical protein
MPWHPEPGVVTDPHVKVVQMKPIYMFSYLTKVPMGQRFRLGKDTKATVVQWSQQQPKGKIFNCIYAFT